jgi:hypothetical protein
MIALLASRVVTVFLVGIVAVASYLWLDAYKNNQTLKPERIAQHVTTENDVLKDPALGIATVESEAPVDISLFAEIIKRPLFSQGRRPPKQRPAVVQVKKPEPNSVVAAVTPAAPKPIDPGNYTLIGVIINDDKQAAFLRAGGETHALHPGDKIEGWTVRSIERTEIFLEQQGVEDHLLLRDSEVKRAGPIKRQVTTSTAARTKPPTRQRATATQKTQRGPNKRLEDLAKAQNRTNGEVDDNNKGHSRLGNNKN